MSSLISIRGLRKSYGRTDVLKGIDLDIPQGKVTAFLGPNGAGKTTTIKCALNLIEPTAGEIRVLGKEPRKLGPAEWRQIGYASENQPSPPDMNLHRWLSYLRPMYGDRWDLALEKTLLKKFNIPPRTSIKSLSRGQRMKAFLLASLTYRPGLVILDEPFAGIDPLARDEILSGLLELSETENWTVWISSHDIEEIQRFSDRVIFLKEGRVIVEEDVETLLARHRTISITFKETPSIPANLPPSWHQPTIQGRSLRFNHQHYDESSSSREIAEIFPGLSRVETHPMNLREVFATAFQCEVPTISETP